MPLPTTTAASAAPPALRAVGFENRSQTAEAPHAGKIMTAGKATSTRPKFGASLLKSESTSANPIHAASSTARRRLSGPARRESSAFKNNSTPARNSTPDSGSKIGRPGTLRIAPPSPFHTNMPSRRRALRDTAWMRPGCEADSAPPGAPLPAFGCVEKIET
jgi:hypothetical protein